MFDLVSEDGELCESEVWVSELIGLVGKSKGCFVMSKVSWGKGMVW